MPRSKKVLATSQATINGVQITIESNVLQTDRWTILKGIIAGGPRSTLHLKFTDSINCVQLNWYIVAHRNDKEFKGYSFFECSPTPGT